MSVKSKKMMWQVPSAMFFFIKDKKMYNDAPNDLFKNVCNLKKLIQSYPVLKIKRPFNIICKIVKF